MRNIIEDPNRHIAPLKFGGHMVTIDIKPLRRCMVGNSIDGFCIKPIDHDDMEADGGEEVHDFQPAEAPYSGPVRYVVNCKACGDDVQHTADADWSTWDGFTERPAAETFATQHRCNHINALVEEVVEGA